MEHKLSYYTVFTDPLDENNENSDRILFATRTGQASIISDSTYRAIKENKWDNIPEEILNELKQNKAIVQFDEKELSTIINENKTNVNEKVLYEVIQPTAMCQLGCDYCGQDHVKSNLDKSLSQKIIDRIEGKILKGGGKLKHLKIGWFGAEPLMAIQQMRFITKELKKLVSKHNMSYDAKVVTNGLSLKENIFIELVKEMHVGKIEVTLDGIADFHDKRRHTKEGHSTFTIIFNNLLKIFNRDNFHNLGCKITIRCNVDKRNFEGVTPLIHLLAKHNLQDKISSFYTASVYSWGNDAHLKSFTKEEYAQLEIDWFIEMYQNGFKPYLLPGRVKTVCMALSPNSEMYDAYGNIFNCTEVSYVPIYEESDYVLGNLKFDEKTHSKKRVFKNWNDEIYENKYQCHSCKMLPVCGGGCPKSWHENMVACPPPKFNIKERLVLSYLYSQGNIPRVN